MFYNYSILVLKNDIKFPQVFTKVILQLLFKYIAIILFDKKILHIIKYGNNNRKNITKHDAIIKRK